MKYYDYKELEVEFSCPRCNGRLYDVTEYFELNHDTWTCENTNTHNFNPEYVKGFWCAKNETK